MSTYTSNPPSDGISGWLARTEAWLDYKGKPAWIAALVVSMIIFWPIGLMLLAYITWSNKLSCSPNRRSLRDRNRPMRGGTGNSAFDAYRRETLRRLEEEQQNFESFLGRLRAARDKAEFDQFMEERTRSSDEGEQDKDDGSDQAQSN